MKLNNIFQNYNTWLITGVAGFIGSNLLEYLLENKQKVIGIDNFITGNKNNLNEVKSIVGRQAWQKFKFIEGDIRDLKTCVTACKGVDFVLHQAALGSVPRSINDPITTNDHNINGFLNMLVAARDNKVSKFIYAASSSTYGDHKRLPKKENLIGNPLSPYAVSKYVNELYAQVFKRNYNLDSIGLRYFNVFGPRQNPNGVYAAVIPKWIDAIIKGDEITINGDGKTSRDFCYIENVIQANIFASIKKTPQSYNQIYNIAVGEKTDLNQLYIHIKNIVEEMTQNEYKLAPIYKEFRKGDVKHSVADISKAKKEFGYNPEFNIYEGLIPTVQWRLKNYNNG